jgi:hypothetical protein
VFGLLFFVSMGFPILSFVNSLSGNLSNRQSDELRLYYMVRPRSQNDGGQPSETVFVWLGFRQSGERTMSFQTPRQSTATQRTLFSTDEIFFKITLSCVSNDVVYRRQTHPRSTYQTYKTYFENATEKSDSKQK